MWCMNVRRVLKALTLFSPLQILNCLFDFQLKNAYGTLLINEYFFQQRLVDENRSTILVK